ncbi:diadenosine tetraphosphate (Ap4A) hydrolase [Candidatus Nitrosoglobus terrae]|uniref:RNA pyrophosphohydrolase n=1 Tax=Candidatus Nitrosoglobus terrae TaxID=1630141 RepID=A0A1Q2SPB7_9GAMM|nr:RNA pyrophosphohydrolase [Candidatus Nitrosoglobus terrae]BAW80953.1 diadenosine tetraphosphate (Ap4A) hydrolase [Candidatus Nitrosoglobus terrae]
MIDQDGFRANVGIILCNRDDKVLWARRVKEESWQFPQGGIKEHETTEEAAYRELEEEIGLGPEHVKIIGCTRNWLRYRLPNRYVRYGNQPLCIGQKQVWYLFRFMGEEQDVRLDLTGAPEFDYWCWVNYWYPLSKIVYFKRKVYYHALNELAPLIFPNYQSLAIARSRRGKRRRYQRRKHYDS